MTQVSLPDIVGRGYKAFWHFTGRYRAVKGGRGSKKSKTTALNIITRMMQYPGANTLVVRKVYRTLRDSCFAELRWAARRLRCEKYWSFRETPLEMTYRPTGQKIFFRGLDDPQKIASLAPERGVLCWLWLEEAFEVTDEKDFDMLDECIRGGGGIFKQVTLTFNPWNEKHWLNRRFFAAKSRNVLAMTATYHCNEFLDAADRKLFADMRRRDPRRYRVAGLGEWGVPEGLIYENWREERFNWRELLHSPAASGTLRRSSEPDAKHTLGASVTEGVSGSARRAPMERDRERTSPCGPAAPFVFTPLFGLDFGYASDPSALFCGLYDPDRRLLYVFDELYEKRLTNRALFERIEEMGYRKERIRADAAEPKSIDELRELGLKDIRAARKGPDSVRAGIKALQGVEIIIHPRCVNFLTEISCYAWDPENPGRPGPCPDHLMDAMRYAMEGVNAGTMFGF
ncbi:MAG: PBSX family phage terminase large subunit [Oscillospiraceae bacterium]|jgi:phage terminase large subunit|nr:PBSX family phage terminase large subunit [Oscillospiraceae bacterium]